MWKQAFELLLFTNTFALIPKVLRAFPQNKILKINFSLICYDAINERAVQFQKFYTKQTWTERTAI